MEKVFHTLEPVFDINSRILILGSFPSPLSRKVGFYYGHPQNRFWHILSSIFGEETPISIENKRTFLINHHIALWDVIYSCQISGASDNSIINAIPNDFSLIFDYSPIQMVFTTGKTAQRLYHHFTEKDSIYLPSPSPANRAIKDDILLKEYSKILAYI